MQIIQEEKNYIESRITSFVPNYNMAFDQCVERTSSIHKPYRAKSVEIQRDSVKSSFGTLEEDWNAEKSINEENCYDARCILNIFEKIDNASLL